MIKENEMKKRWIREKRNEKNKRGGGKRGSRSEFAKISSQCSTSHSISINTLITVGRGLTKMRDGGDEECDTR